MSKILIIHEKILDQFKNFDFYCKNQYENYIIIQENYKQKVTKE